MHEAELDDSLQSWSLRHSQLACCALTALVTLAQRKLDALESEQVCVERGIKLGPVLC